MHNPFGAMMRDRGAALGGEEGGGGTEEEGEEVEAGGREDTDVEEEEEEEEEREELNGIFFGPGSVTQAIRRMGGGSDSGNGDL